jgi:site-specific DNA-methyltransferase (adenine-specific)
VLDPFNGSGTTGIAALLESRNFLGYEKAEEYFIQSRKRNEAHFEVESNEKDKLFIARLKKS